MKLLKHRIQSESGIKPNMWIYRETVSERCERVLRRCIHSELTIGIDAKQSLIKVQTQWIYFRGCVMYSFTCSASWKQTVSTGTPICCRKLANLSISCNRPENAPI